MICLLNILKFIADMRSQPKFQSNPTVITDFSKIPYFKNIKEPPKNQIWFLKKKF